MTHFAPKKRLLPDPVARTCILCGTTTNDLLAHIKKDHDELYQPRSKKGKK